MPGWGAPLYLPTIFQASTPLSREEGFYLAETAQHLYQSKSMTHQYLFLISQAANL